MTDNTEQIDDLRDQIECIELSDDEMDLNSGQSGSGRDEDNQTNDDRMEVDPEESNSVRSDIQKTFFEDLVKTAGQDFIALILGKFEQQRPNTENIIT